MTIGRLTEEQYNVAESRLRADRVPERIRNHILLLLAFYLPIQRMTTLEDIARVDTDVALYLDTRRWMKPETKTAIAVALARYRGTPTPAQTHRWADVIVR